MRTFLCWCICLWVVGSRQTVDGRNCEPRLRLSSALQTPATQPNPPHKSYRLPTTDYRLPCEDSSSNCVNNLVTLAMKNSRQLVVLEQAIQLQKKKLWTNWLNADGLHPLAIGLRIARNFAGGGDRAEAKLEIARLEVRRSETETELRQAIVNAIIAIESAQRQEQEADSKLRTHRNRLQLLTAAYRLGEGSTETMLQLWQTEAELQLESEKARLSLSQFLRQLQSLVFPNFTSSNNAK
jgi:hypothetical protein